MLFPLSTRGQILRTNGAGLWYYERYGLPTRKRSKSFEPYLFWIGGGVNETLFIQPHVGMDIHEVCSSIDLLQKC